MFHTSISSLVLFYVFSQFMILCAYHITKIAILLSKFQSVNMGNFFHLIIIGLEGAWDVMEIHLKY